MAGKNENEATNRPLITLPRRLGQNNDNYDYQKNRNRNQSSPSQNGSHSRSRSRSYSRSRSPSRTSSLNNTTRSLNSPLRSQLPSPSHSRSSKDLFSRSPSPSKNLPKLSMPSNRFILPPLRSPSRSWSRSPKRRQMITFRGKNSRFSDTWSKDGSLGGQRGGVSAKARTPSKSPPPRTTLKSTVVRPSPGRSSPFNYRYNKNANQVRQGFFPSSHAGSRSELPRLTLHQSSPHSFRSMHEHKILMRPMSRPGYSPPLMRQISSPEREHFYHENSNSDYYINDYSEHSSKGLHYQKSTQIFANQQNHFSDDAMNPQPKSYQNNVLQSPSIDYQNNTSNLDYSGGPKNLPMAPYSLGSNTSSTIDLPQKPLSSNNSTINDATVPAGAVPLDENGLDEANSLVTDFHPQTSKPYFVKGENTISFTPCLETFYENICTAMKELKYPPAFFETITSYSEARRLALTRILEATVVLAVGQSCAISYNNTTAKRVSDFSELTIAEFPVLRALRMIASQYGSVKCPQTGDCLSPVDHAADVRAVVRMAAFLLPEVTQTEEINGKATKQLVPLSDTEGRNVAARSWLPTYANDKRFLLIFSLKVKEFMKSKLNIFPSATEMVEALSSLKKETPRWWTIFREQLPREANGRFDFLWQNWNDETFYQNLGEHPAAPSALNAIGLKWPSPAQNHLFFNISLKNEIIRVYKHSFANLKLYAANFKLMTCVELSPDHQGSWNQLASVINYMGWKVFKNCRETNKATQNLALRFPPKIYHDKNV